MVWASSVWLCGQEHLLVNAMYHRKTIQAVRMHGLRLLGTRGMKFMWVVGCGVWRVYGRVEGRWLCMGCGPLATVLEGWG